MKKEQFEFNELPYPTLARFGLTQEMIEDLAPVYPERNRERRLLAGTAHACH